MGLDSLPFWITEFDTKERHGIAGNGLWLCDVVLAEFIGFSLRKRGDSEKANEDDEYKLMKSPLHSVVTR
jgi:hypothetical protein